MIAGSTQRTYTPAHSYVATDGATLSVVPKTAYLAVDDTVKPA